MKFKPYLIILIIFFSFIRTEAQDFEVSPVKMYFSIDPGDSQTQVLSITNHASFKTSFTISFEDFVIDIDGTKLPIKRNSSKNSCTEWITPEKTFFDINPNEQIQINITMQAPDDDYTPRWALMYIQTARVQTGFSADKELQASVNLSGRIAVNIYRLPLTQSEPDIIIKQLQEIVDAESDLRTFSATVDNKGNTITKCKVMFIASDINTGEEFEFDPIKIETHPGFPIDVKFTLPEFLPPGQYSFYALLDIGNDNTIKGTRLKETLVILEKDNQE